MSDGTGTTYLLVDGENVDATLGVGILQRRPTSAERPRWERLRDFARALWDQPVRGLFFLNASKGELPMSFVQALLAMDYRPIPLAGRDDEKVVDIGIQRTLAAIADRPGDVLLVSHDVDFFDHVSRLVGGERRVGIVGFREYASARFSELHDQGLRFYDLEDDVGCFTHHLPRVRVIPLAEFDPERYL